MPNRRIVTEIHAAALRGMLDPAIPMDNLRVVLGGISLRTQQRAAKRLEETGTLQFDKSNKGRPRVVPREVVEHILWLVHDNPAICLKTVKSYLQTNGYYLTVPTIGRILEREGLTYKSIKKRAIERSAIIRTEFIHRMADYSCEQLVFIDESAKDERTCTRSYGWGMRGKDAVVDVPFRRGTRYSILPAMTLEGYIALDIVEGPYNTAMFEEFIEQSLLPLCQPYPHPRSVLIMDNCQIHKGINLLPLLERHGVRLEYLPGYSPDLNPIEESFACLKAFIRRQPDFLASNNPVGDLAWAAQQAITPDKCVGWIRHSGYALE